MIFGFNLALTHEIRLYRDANNISCYIYIRYHIKDGCWTVLIVANSRKVGKHRSV